MGDPAEIARLGSSVAHETPPLPPPAVPARPVPWVFRPRYGYPFAALVAINGGFQIGTVHGVGYVVGPVDLALAAGWVVQVRQGRRRVTKRPSGP